jgi:hypothetical protein
MAVSRPVMPCWLFEKLLHAFMWSPHSTWILTLAQDLQDAI